MPLLVSAPDKYRGTVSAGEAAAAAAGAARRAGWEADEVPMSDGGEGLLEAVDGDVHSTTVSGPLGTPVRAEWRMLRDLHDAGPTAVVEMSRAAGRSLLPHPSGDEVLRADTTGVGELLLAARDAGARRIIVGCGGSATTDGGRGAFDAVGSVEALRGVELVVASDVTTRFNDAAAVFGPQKGATAPQVTLLAERLEELARRYVQETGVDVSGVAGAGAAGGLAGGLVALGARIEPGFDLVARLVGLAGRVAVADLVMTGEGHLDPPSFAGKVPGGVLELARRRTREGRALPVLCVVGGADRKLVEDPPQGMEVVSLTARYGRPRARSEAAVLIAEVVADAIARFCL